MKCLKDAEISIMIKHFRMKDFFIVIGKKKLLIFIIIPCTC